MSRRLPGFARIAGGLLLLVLASAVAPGGTPVGAQDRAALVAQGRVLFAQNGCFGCHTVGKVGTPIGPDLSRASAKYGEGELARWLTNPAAQEPTRHMPQLDLSDPEAQALAAFLASLP